MIEANGSDRHEFREIVRIRSQIALPRDDVERRMIEFRDPESAAELRDQLEGLISLLECGGRRSEMTRIGETVGPDGTELRKPQHRAVVFPI